MEKFKAKKPKVAVNVVVYNGEKYIKRCLEHAKKQTYDNIEISIFNNASEDNTIEIAQNNFPEINIVNFPQNYGLGGGFNRSVHHSKDADYIVLLCVDVAMEPDFIEKAVYAMEENETMGVLQSKIMRYDYEEDKNTDIIDTVGVEIYKSRRMVNIGHGEKDEGQYEEPGEIFCYEGAVPLFRKKALDDAAMLKEIHDSKYPYEYLDEDFFWYADDFDLGWRLRILGWGTYYDPKVISWHDRQTTHQLSRSYREFIKQRREIPAFKRRLDLQNMRLTFIKNDFWVNIILDAPWFVKREFMLFVYVLIWERSSLPAYWNTIKFAPKMLRKRREIMQKRVVLPKEMRKWFK